MISSRSNFCSIGVPRRVVFSFAGSMLALMLGSSAHAANLADVNAQGEQWLVAQAASQKRVDAMAEQSHDLANDYRATLRETEGLKLYMQQMREQLKSQDQEMESIRRESQELDRTNIEIQPLMVKMLDSLQQFVALDIPFLKQERTERIAKLNEMMSRADVTVSEKYRRIVESYQIEMEYGRTIEAYRGTLKDKEVDFLRVGRIGLFYQTPDGTQTGYWDRDKKDWVADNDYTEGVKKGLKVARKQTSPDLLIVPVRAAAKGAK